MANNYKVKVQVEIVECTDAVTDAPSQVRSGYVCVHHSCGASLEQGHYDPQS